MKNSKIYTTKKKTCYDHYRMKNHYDIIIIGSGGGSKFTQPCANLGLKVAIIEKGRFGGTCLNHGCIPSKLLIQTAKITQTINTAQRYQIHTQQAIPDFKNIMEYTCNEIDHESDKILPLYLKNKNITVYRESASFLNDKEVKVGNKILTANKIIITAGARAKIPNIKGLEKTPFMTYKEALRLQNQPKKMIIIGAGYIATELGYFYQEMGTDVTVIARNNILSNEDHEIQKVFETEFSKLCKLKKNTAVKEIRYKNKEFMIVSKNNKSNKIELLSADSLLIATGVTPNTDILKIENTSIKMNEEKFIKVNKYLETSVKNIWSYGDIIGDHLYRHTANFQGEYLFKTLFKSHKKNPIKYPSIPYAIFSYPEIGVVGPTEKELIKKKVNYISVTNLYKHSAMGQALRSERGLVKLLFDKNTKKLLGSHIIGQQASTLVHMLIAYINMGATLEDLLNTIYIHPALPEVIRNAARKAKIKLKDIS